MQFDPRTESSLASLDVRAQVKFRAFIERAVAVAADLECQYVAISGNRTWRDQDALYAIGRSKPGRKVTNAKGGQSNHNFGIALDFGVFRAGKYLDETELKTASMVHREVAKEAAAFGIEWGGSWKSITDEPHFEVITGLTLAQKRDRYQQSGTVLA